MTEDEMVEAAILHKQFCRDAVRHAIQMERDACASVAEECMKSGAAYEIPRAIRARSNENETN